MSQQITAISNFLIVGSFVGIFILLGSWLKDIARQKQYSWEKMRGYWYAGMFCILILFEIFQRLVY
jgi:hypothetical protein